MTFQYRWRAVCRKPQQTVSYNAAWQPFSATGSGQKDKLTGNMISLLILQFSCPKNLYDLIIIIWPADHVLCPDWGYPPARPSVDQNTQADVPSVHTVLIISDKWTNPWIVWLLNKDNSDSSNNMEKWLQVSRENWCSGKTFASINVGYWLVIVKIILLEINIKSIVFFYCSGELFVN